MVRACFGATRTLTATRNGPTWNVPGAAAVRSGGRGLVEIVLRDTKLRKSHDEIIAIVSLCRKKSQDGEMARL
ncbi:hypothetical protein KGA66_22225 [Actinocrinis puniceicyclus]|uniref:Uncharacterized protein n=1 Tax=Actinocrinis puniceicyclus TaxID=977794 RepID=A0A8J7WNS6_9ACTN|nr:hypothetical protein [Actinocrinis puniceicyclus]MBS2965786.1 hypothetical protein [Actinocrinis puniceicyclus]